MSTQLPNTVRAAVNRNAHRLAQAKAYKAIRDELEDMACNLAQQPQASTQAVIDELDHADLDYVPRSSALNDA